MNAVLRDGVDAYKEYGCPEEWRRHHQGGPVGYQSREAVAVPSSSAVIQPGVAFAWNPSITGAKAEDTFVLLAENERVIVTRDPEWPVGDDGEPGLLVASF